MAHGANKQPGEWMHPASHQCSSGRGAGPPAPAAATLQRSPGRYSTRSGPYHLDSSMFWLSEPSQPPERLAPPFLAGAGAAGGAKGRKQAQRGEAG